MNCINQASGSDWTAYHGDCVEVLRGLPDHCIDYSIFSPPFASLYTYSNSPRDMGNCRNDAEFFEHFGHLVAELRRVMKPGRNVSFHCMLMPTSKERDGYIGLRDFRGDLIRAFQAHGFIYHAEVCMDIDPNDTLQFRSAREHDDERHICPLQLPVIRRGIDLWTNPGEVVLTPFGGIGSEGYAAVEMGRRAVLVELKDSYFGQLVRNMQAAGAQGSLFGDAP
jgi:DNA modification methylase